jgi:hypothetical protein
METYGFVYIWRDRKHKRYYIGSHWGTETDGYICSSRWMRKSYKRRPHDFKRRILSRIFTNRLDLLNEEYKYLKKIKDEKIGSKYYNLTKHQNGHWSINDKTRLSVGQKISASPNRNANISKAHLGKKITEEQKEKNSIASKKQFADPKQRELMSNIITSKWEDPEYRKKMSEAHMGWKWFNNGSQSIKIVDGALVPFGFTRGRIKTW